MTGRGRSSYSSWLVVEVEEEAVDLVIGTYRCSAENDFGSSAMELLVSGAPISCFRLTETAKKCDYIPHFFHCQT